MSRSIRTGKWPLKKRLKFFSRRLKNGCHQWDSSTSTAGYGQISVAGVLLYAHRVAYEVYVGPIPKGLDIDHLCRNRACINPKHLEAVTRKENLHRGETWEWRLKKQHCYRGHPFAGSNLRRGKGRIRICRACENIRCAKYRARKLHASA